MHSHQVLQSTLGSLLVLYILWAVTNKQWHVSVTAVSHRILKKKKKILSAVSIHPSLPPFRATTDPSYCLHSFTFPRRSCSWNHTVQSLSRLASFTNAHWRFLHVFSWLVSSLFFALNNTALSECITHLLKDILVASKFRQIWVKLL